MREMREMHETREIACFGQVSEMELGVMNAADEIRESGREMR